MIFTHVNVVRGRSDVNGTVVNAGNTIASNVYVQIDVMSLFETIQLGGSVTDDRYEVYTLQYADVQRGDVLIDPVSGRVYDVISFPQQFPDNHCEAIAMNHRAGGSA